MHLSHLLLELAQSLLQDYIQSMKALLILKDKTWIDLT